MTAPRDWDKELAEIDKLMSNQPAALPAPAGSKAQPARPAAPVPPPAATGKAAWGTWLRVLLGVLAGAALTQWPYARQCGLGVLLYLGAVGVVTLAGLWGAVAAWRKRMGLAHAIALLVMLWGLILAAAVVLPRTGYARATANWLCS